MSATRPVPPPSSTMAPKPGWYPDEGVMRYWDGSQWTDQTRPLPYLLDSTPTETGPAPGRESAGAIVGVGYVLAVLIPVIGFIIGIVVATRPAKVTSKHGAWIIVLSVVVFFVYLALIVNAASTTTPRLR